MTQTLWCTEATAAAFGVEFHAGPSGSAMLVELTRALRLAGLAVEPDYTVTFDGAPTLSRFMKEHPTGDFIVATAGHVMALRDGVLTDTDELGTGRRRVQLVYRVSVA